MATLEDLSVAELDAQIAHHEWMSLSLKMRRNQRSAIAKLPQEILLVIIVKAIEDGGHHRLSRFAVLRRITHVCKVWRHVAIHSPLLWTRVPIYPRMNPVYPSKHEWTQLALSRSKNLLLDVALDHFPKGSHAQKMALQELPRIAKLSLTGTLYELERARRVIAAFPSAPQLTSLHMECIPASTTDDHWTYADVSDAVLVNSGQMPLDFLADASRLRNVSLINLNFNFDAPLFSNLTTLSISSQSAVPVSSWTPLKDALGRMPLLISLTLHLILVTVPGIAPLNKHPVLLKHLQSLSLHMRTPEDVQAVLSFITVPPIKHLSLQWLQMTDSTSFAIQSDLFLRAAELIHAKDTGSSFTKIQFIAARSCPVPIFRASAPEVEGGPFLELKYPLKRRSLDNLADITELITKTLTLSSVTHLAFETFWDDHYTDSEADDLYSNLLDALPHIQTLSVRGWNGYHFLNLLYRSFVGRLVEGKLLRELKTIIWKRVDLKDKEEWICFNFLSNLDERVRNGIPLLQKLILEDVKNVTPEMTGWLQETIPSVIQETTDEYFDIDEIDSEWEIDQDE